MPATKPMTRSRSESNTCAEVLDGEASRAKRISIWWGASKICLNETFDNLLLLRDTQKPAVQVSRSNKIPFDAGSEEYEFLRITYRCIHSDIARVCSTGKCPKQSNNSTGSEMFLSVALCKTPSLDYKFTQLKTEHNRDLGHYNLFRNQTLLNDIEKSDLSDSDKCNVAPREFEKIVQEKTGKTVSTKDVHSFRKNVLCTSSESGDSWANASPTHQKLN